MSDLELPIMRARMASDPGPRIIRLVQPIASRFTAPIIGFGNEPAAQTQHTEQRLTLTHPHG